MDEASFRDRESEERERMDMAGTGLKVEFRIL